MRQRQAADGERTDPRDPAPTLASELPPHSIPAAPRPPCGNATGIAGAAAALDADRIAPAVGRNLPCPEHIAVGSRQ